jgi:AcrR family transcriptional regulator
VNRRTQHAIAGAIDVTVLANAPRQKRSQALSVRILEAAERVLRRSGIAAFTIAAVAAEAEVSVGGIYGRFENRDELLAAIHGEALTRIQDQIEAALQRPFSSLTEVAEVFATQTVEVIHSVGDLMPVVGRKADLSNTNRVEGNIRVALWQAVQPFRSEVRHSDPETAVRMAVHLTLASLMRERMSPPDATDRLMGWENLARELPRVVRGVLTGGY